MSESDSTASAGDGGGHMLTLYITESEVADYEARGWECTFYRWYNCPPMRGYIATYEVTK
jgi:hypothetical protein